jgi:hypothetical protein
MTDDLVKRLRQGVMCGDDPIVDEAADRIEKLEENIELQLEWYLSNKRVLDGRIAKLEAALDDMSQYVSRADWHYLKPETIAALEGKDG